MDNNLRSLPSDLFLPLRSCTVWVVSEFQPISLFKLTFCCLVGWLALCSRPFHKSVKILTCITDHILVWPLSFVSVIKFYLCRQCVTEGHGVSVTFISQTTARKLAQSGFVCKNGDKVHSHWNYNCSECPAGTTAVVPLKYNTHITLNSAYCDDCPAGLCRANSIVVGGRVGEDSEIEGALVG